MRRTGCHAENLINSYDPSCAYFVKATINVPEELHDYFDYAPIKKGKIDPELLSASTRARLGKTHNVKL